MERLTLGSMTPKEEKWKDALQLQLSTRALIQKVLLLKGKVQSFSYKSTPQAY